jgi:hypothetical protein
MTAPTLFFGILLLTQNPTPPGDGNALFDTLRAKGAEFGRVRIDFPAPLLAPGMSADQERAALKALTGSDRALADFTRDSVSAPHILKTRDVPAEQGTVRIADAWFIVRASLDSIEPARVDAATADGKPVEAANMRFSAARIDPKDLASRHIEPENGKDRQEWFVHFTGRLLDRIHLEATDQVLATKSPGAWVIAAYTDPRFNDDKTAPNRWHPIRREGSAETNGPDETYPGGASYVKIGKLASVEGALLVEVHGAFFEPKAWFDGAPVLRSKIGIVAQDRIRSLRRELAKAKSRTGVDDRSPTGAPGR